MKCKHGIPIDEECMLERFWDKVLFTTDCWEWQGYIAEMGYGRFWDGKKTTYAHRTSYKIHNGFLPTSLQIDHLCKNRICVNPHHLEPVTPQENNQRSNSVSAKHIGKTHCVRGHLLLGDNLYLRKDGRGRGCRKCRAINKQEWADKNREHVREYARELAKKKKISQMGEWSYKDLIKTELLLD